MKIQKSHLRLALFVLGAAVLYSVYVFMRPAPRQSAPIQPQQPLIQTGAGPSAGTQIDPMAIRPPVDVDLARAPGWVRDPFIFGDESRSIVARAINAAPEGPAPTVRSILYSPGRKLAIVNGKIVAIGDMVGSLKVTNIESSAVTFAEPDGRPHRVPLYGALPTGMIR
jgi:hypothetical protein